MVLFWSSVTLSVIAAVGCGYLVVAAITVGRFARGGLRTGPVTTPDVTILKPLHGSEPGLLENLASFCSQDYAGRIQIICGVQDPNDAAVAVVERLRSGEAARDFDLVIEPKVHGLNRKVSNLVNMAPADPSRRHRHRRQRHSGRPQLSVAGRSRRCNAPVAV